MTREVPTWDLDSEPDTYLDVLVQEFRSERGLPSDTPIVGELFKAFIAWREAREEAKRSEE